MKIILIGPAYPLRGGIADTNESLARALQNDGHEVEIKTFKLQYPNFLFPGKTQFSEEKAPETLNIDLLVNSINPFNWIKTARRINKAKPDFVIIRYWLPFMSPCLGSIARMLNKKIKVIALTDNIIPHERRAFDTIFTKYFVNPCDAFVTLSRTVEEELKEFTRKPIMYNPHPINDNFGEKIPKSKAREILKLDSDGKYILFFGLIRKYKGLDLLLEAMADSRLKELDVRLVIAGEFYDKPEEYLDIIEKYKMSDRIIIENQFIPLSEIRNYFSAADLSVQTYHSASQSGITQIAFHFDLPMLVTNVGGLSEIVENGKIGYVVEKNPTEIADAIMDFYNNNRFDTFTKNVEIEKKKFSWQQFSENLIHLYTKIIS